MRQYDIYHHLLPDIRSREKLFEVRSNTQQYRGVEEGEHIVLRSRTSGVEVEVTSKQTYNTIDEVFTDHSPETLAPSFSIDQRERLLGEIWCKEGYIVWGIRYIQDAKVKRNLSGRKFKKKR